MKKSFCLLILVVLILGSMSACTQDNSKKTAVERQKVERNKQGESTREDKRLINFDQENENRLEQGILLYGESTKGGYYLTTVNTAYIDKKVTVNNPYTVVVKVTVKNIRGEQVDLSELKFNLKDDKDNKTFDGKVLQDKNSSDMHIRPNELKTLNISFEVPNIEEEYMFYIKSSLDPIPTHWKINNLTQSNS